MQNTFGIEAARLTKLWAVWVALLNWTKWIINFAETMGLFASGRFVGSLGINIQVS